MALNVNSDIVSRDISFFYCGLQCGSDNRLYKYPIHKGNCFCVSCGNVHLLYYLTVRRDSVNHGYLDKLYLTKILGFKNNVPDILLQIGIALRA